ncbi:hypothetical protein CA13_25450 [Planctomycetes bacterium CA13]|uniref:Uncharacterized protein n=1 Tax=Novipirellula herctigrandis TaxID=2527986 RepID=A0A5C5Z143_9BACT|nr:hypothetical protein CA13_25450 [Planctomycetes bacterium CA13]
MSYDNESVSPMFRIDVSPQASAESDAPESRVVVELLQQLVTGQSQQNRLLQELMQQNAAMQKQRAGELQQWKDSNPELSRACREAAETLSRVQTRFLDTMTEDILENDEHLMEGEFMLNEFVDRFGPRLAHLNGVLQVLAQLGTGQPIQQNQ